MRRFDKKSVIREANQRLEKEFLTKKLSLSEQTNETGNITGTVTGEGGTLPGVTVGIVDEAGVIKSAMGQFTDTDSDGKYKLKNVPVGDVKIKFSIVGYKAEIIGQKIVSGDNTVDVTLTPDVTQLDTVEVTDKKIESKEEVKEKPKDANNKTEEKSKEVTKKDNSTKDTKKAFEIFKRDFNLVQKDDGTASGSLVGSGGLYNITIKQDGTYTITDKKNNNEFVQGGKFKSKGLIGKHIELTPDSSSDVFKVGTIVQNLNKERPQITKTDLINYFTNIVKDKSKLQPLNQEYLRYVFGENKLGTEYGIQLAPSDKEGAGTFFLVFKEPESTKFLKIANSNGEYTNYGAVLTLNLSPETPVEASGKSKISKIDNGLIELLKKVHPEYTKTNPVN